MVCEASTLEEESEHPSLVKWAGVVKRFRVRVALED